MNARVPPPPPSTSSRSGDVVAGSGFTFSLPSALLGGLAPPLIVAALFFSEHFSSCRRRRRRGRYGVVLRFALSSSGLSLSTVAPLHGDADDDAMVPMRWGAQRRRSIEFLDCAVQYVVLDRYDGTQYK